MNAYYRLCRLELGKSLVLGDPLCVDLDLAAGSPAILCDDDFSRSSGTGNYFWVSGGGSVLLGEQHLLVVQRSPDGRVNPGKFSLFTGRADEPAEWQEPRLLLRELFEELCLVDAAGRLLLPELSEPVLDVTSVCRSSAERLGRTLAERGLRLVPIDLGGQEVRIRCAGVTRTSRLLVHVNQARDINVLFLFRASCAVEDCWALDGEGGRRIFALDLRTMLATEVSWGAARDQIAIAPEMLTEHCRFLVERLRERAGARDDANHC